jgi:hypothetical protein
MRTTIESINNNWPFEKQMWYEKYVLYKIACRAFVYKDHNGKIIFSSFSNSRASCLGGFLGLMSVEEKEKFEPYVADFVKECL